MNPVLSTLMFSVLLLLTHRIQELVEACSCAPAHPQQLICDSALGESQLLYAFTFDGRKSKEASPTAAISFFFNYSYSIFCTAVGEYFN